MSFHDCYWRCGGTDCDAPERPRDPDEPPARYETKPFIWIGCIRFSLDRQLTRRERVRAWLAGYHYELLQVRV